MLPGYELIEELAGNDRIRLMRARHVADGKSVLIQLPRHNPPREADLTALRHEAAILASLPVDGVLRPLSRDLQYEDALTLEDPHVTPLTSLLATQRPLDLRLVLALGIQLAGVLDQLYRGGMIHNGVRPDAILFNAAGARAWLTDFSDTCGGVADAHAPPRRPLTVARLTYASPEQTGRLNRSVDYRSDLYSLGVVLYELLTGAPPFQSGDALELIHGHVARTPPSPAALNVDVPKIVSDIVMKLLAKSVDERYQSALALKEDLKLCARQFDAYRSIEPFPLGRRDAGDRFLISHKLYGREQEVKVLRAALDRICGGHATSSSMLVVAGYSGIGKTALIEELYKPIVREKGYFIAGKFDQVVRNIPFGALIPAFRILVQQLLTESETRLGAWRSSLAQALGANSGVLAEVIPEIEYLLGKQSPPVPIGPNEALNRFQLVFQNFVAALARPEHPLIVFLDDLQWADAATLGLLKPLLRTPEIRSLLLIGAYRDNEVDTTHPLLRTLADVESAGIALDRIALGPLQLTDLTLLIADTLRRDPDDVGPLAHLVQQKTGGNPFFVTQFLKALHDEGYITFDHAANRWIYRMTAIERAPITDNVIDLMTRKLERLSARTRRVLTLAACIGNAFDQDTLAIVSETPAAIAAEDLAEAISEGLLQRRSDAYGATLAGDGTSAAYAFLHDRVQQSAYALIPAEQKQSVHLTVGRLLLSNTPSEAVDERIFDIVHHLNLGRSLVDSDQERLTLARLNLHAGFKAKSSTAYQAALDYLRAGLSLLIDERWKSDYELAFRLHLEAAECEYLCGRFGEAEAHLDLLLTRANNPLDQAEVQNLRLLQYESASRYQDAIRIGHHALSLCGLEFPSTTEQRSAALDAETAAINEAISARGLTDLSGVQPMTDPATRMMMRLCTNLHTSCYLSGDKTLTMLNTATMVRLSLVHGNCSESAYAYALYAAMLLVPLRRDYLAAYEFGQLALRVNDRFPAPAIRARVMMNLGWAVSLWRRPMTESIVISREAHRLGNDNGMFVEATYALFNDCWLSLLSSPALSRFNETCRSHVTYARRVGMQHFAAAPQIILQWGRALQGLTNSPTSLSAEDFDEGAFRRDYRGQPLFEMFYAVAKLALSYTFGDFHAARDFAREAERVIRDFPGTIWDQQTSYYHALTLIELYPELEDAERKEADRLFKATAERLEHWAANAPANFRVPYLIVSAELARLAGNNIEAIDLLDAATSATCECPREHALANELLGRFWLRRGNVKLAAPHAHEAYALYAEWGAEAKVRDLERKFSDALGQETRRVPRVRPEDSHDQTPGLVGADAVTLDLFSAMKAARAIAGEIELDQLLARLMRIAIENAGAECGSLLLEHDGASFVHAEGSLHSTAIKVHDGISLEESKSVPQSMINYVRRTLEAVVIADASSDERFGADPYIVRHRPRSAMCVPVLKQGLLTGVLYLENSVVFGAFTPDRIQLMQMLSTEAAISLENARLVAGLKREIRERTEATERLHAALQEVEQLKIELEAENVYLRRDLIANVSHDLRTPLASLRGYLETLLLKDDSLQPATRRSYLDTAFRQSERLANLIDELFELAKLDFKGLQLDMEPVQLGELASDVVQKFQLSAERKNVRLAIDAWVGSLFVRADPGLVQRVFENLIDNALKHTPSGGTIQVTVVPEQGRVVARVADTGSGIPAAELPFIFHRFYQVNKSRDTAAGGAGLGLAIAKRILELHASDITAESMPGAGTCFSFSLPAQHAALSM